jgi:hypothetical protein
VQQVYKVLRDIENLAGWAQAKVEESCEWTSISSSVKENRVNFCEALDGKSLLSALYCMYAVPRNELKAVLKATAQAG